MLRNALRLRLLTTIVLPSLLALCAGCGGNPSFEAPPATAETFESPDLSLNELTGRVKSVRTTTFYKATPDRDFVTVEVDTMPENVMVTTVYFDSLGTYVARRDERIRRDAEGRMTRWEDRRPNLNRQHGGFLKDTLSYEHVSPYLLRTEGMAEYATIVYDERHRVVGQYSAPAVDGETSAVFNLYRTEDEEGNWTERLSIWNTAQPGDRPHTSYTLERREITYYRH